MSGGEGHSASGSYWLLRWFDAEGIADLDVALGVLRTDGGIERLAAAAHAALTPPLALAPEKNAIVAGPALDLSGYQSCMNPKCLKRDVDEIVRHSWLYFDRAIVQGASPRQISVGIKSMDRERLLDLMRGHLDVALYVRESGAEKIFTFERQREYCTEHMDQHCREVGLPDLATAADELERQLLDGYSLERGRTELGPLAIFAHPSLNYISTKYVDADTRNDAELAASIARYEARVNVARLVTKVALARESGATLGQTTARLGRSVELKSDPDAGPSPADVAVNISLPYLEGATAGDLLALRQTDDGEFEVFRGALKKTIEERLKALPGDDAGKVASSVVDDVLRPAVAALDRKAKRSATLVRKRSAGAIAVGGAMTTIGLLAFAPVTVPGMMLGVGGLLANYQDLLKDKRDVELSDLHFLWRVSNQAAGLHD